MRNGEKKMRVPVSKTLKSKLKYQKYLFYKIISILAGGGILFEDRHIHNII